VREAPPSSLYSGTPAFFAAMSHRAMSIAATAAMVTGPRRQYGLR
jgi:hypothetical protein